MVKKIDPEKHTLVPKHQKLSDKEKENVLKKYNITLIELPKISKKDSAIKHLNPKSGEVIKITRNSPTAGEAIFYRGVVDV